MPEKTHYKKDGSASSYYLVPAHKLLLPKAGSAAHLIHTLTTELIARNDNFSSSELADYPLISDKHRRLHFSDWQILEIVRPVVISKPRAAVIDCSGYEEKKERITARLQAIASQKAKDKRAAARADKQYSFDLSFGE